MSSIKLFETKQVRSLWDAEKEAWFFIPTTSMTKKTAFITGITGQDGSYLAEAKKHALLKKHGYVISVSVE